jgi:hypothetical protein
MENKINYKRTSKLASLITALGALFMVIAFVVFMLLNKKKSEALEVKDSELQKKDSITSVLQDSIQKLAPPIEPFAYAVATGRQSRPGVSYMPREAPEFIYSVGLVVADSLKRRIERVSYFFDHPSFQRKNYVTSNLSDSFKISYRGWGCLDTVRIIITMTHNETNTLYFRMCDNLKLKGQNVAVH